VAQPFAQTNNCPATLAAGVNCAISVTFTPQTSGAVNGTLTITDNASGSPQGVSVAGSGAVAAPTLSPTSLSFGTQDVRTTSGSKTVKLTANSPGPLTISSISVSSGFTQSNNCPASLNPGSSCNINIVFQPTTAGAVTGTLTVVDNGLGNPQSIPLSGTGLDFSVSAAPSSVTIGSGAKANYTVTVSEVGGSFNQNVSLSCSGLPAQSTCSFSPSGVTPGSGAANSALMIKTTKANGTSGTQPGTYTITITGTAIPLVHSATVTLVVD
jgi:Abnormal spindle-like microcephaly-assoc'd, ASPM-SPD-2-Hydin